LVSIFNRNNAHNFSYNYFGEKLIISRWHEIESEIRQTASGIETAAKKRLREKKIEKLKEIESQVTTLQEELDNYQKTYKSIINKHTSLQHIFEIIFPEFLRRLELRLSVR
jgi:hypothetical protein